MKTYTPARARAELHTQHQALRIMMDRCEEMATRLEAQQLDPAVLVTAVTNLRAALDAHNAFEEAVLRPVLTATDRYSDVRIGRLVEDHVAEHRELRDRLHVGNEVTQQLRDVLETLRAHLEAEERYLLNAQVLRDDARV